MSIAHVEVRNSREGKDSTKRASRTQLAYHLMGSDDIPSMRSYLTANNLVPNKYDGLIYEDIDRKYLGPGSWLWEANYVESRKSDESNDQLDLGEYRVSFDTTGGQVKLFWTPDHTNRVTGYSNVTFTDEPDYKGGINMRKGANGVEPQGVEVLIPALKYTIHYRRTKDTTEAAWFSYMDAIAGITARTNDASFKGSAAGEVLFLGGNGSQGIESDPVLDFHFIKSPNLTGLIFDTINSVDKGGHDYIWVESEPIKDPTTGRITPNLVAVYVHQLYEPVSFSAIGVGS